MACKHMIQCAIVRTYIGGGDVVVCTLDKHNKHFRKLTVAAVSMI